MGGFTKGFELAAGLRSVREVWPGRWLAGVPFFFSLFRFEDG